MSAAADPPVGRSPADTSGSRPAGPLAGLRIAVTRAPDQAVGLAGLLAAEGAHVATFPLIRIEAVLPAAELAAALRARPDWVVFTSANAVRVCAAALEAEGATLADVLAGAGIAVVGPATAEAAGEQGLPIDAMPETYVGDAMAAAMGGPEALRGRRVLWPRAEAARETVAATIREAGAIVTAPVAYRSVPDREGAESLARSILQRDVDVVTFTSPSCVRSLAAVLPRLEGVTVAAIGPITADAATGAGYPVHVIAVDHTADGLAHALVRARQGDAG